MDIRTKRIYERPSPDDGCRVLIDRIWPRGVSKEKAAIDYWAKDCAPTTELRKWYGHEPEKWSEFQRRYSAELEEKPNAINELCEVVSGETLTLLFASKETELNNATALKEFMERKGLP